MAGVASTGSTDRIQIEVNRGKARREKPEKLEIRNSKQIQMIKK